MGKVLITGSSGFLGSTIVNDYSHLFGDIIAVSRSTRVPSKDNVKNYAVDICEDTFIDLVQENSPSAIIHTAARSIVRDCEQNPAQAFRQNVQGTVNVLEAARRLNTNIPVVVLETDKVYGQQPPECIPTPETATLLGNSPYEYSKVMTAQVCEFYRSYYGMNIYSLRPANIYGYWDKNMSRIVPGTFDKVQRGESPVIFTGSESQLREYVYVDDVAVIISQLIDQLPEVGAYNIDGCRSNPQDLMVEIMHVMDRVVPIKVQEKPFQFNEIQNQALDGSKLRKTIDVKFTPLRESLEMMWERIKTTKGIP
jgi:UDP-glucose 4-epimerase